MTMGKRGASEEQCGFACEAFCIKWGFFEFSERVRSPTEGGQHSRRFVHGINTTVRRNFLQSRVPTGVALPHGRASDTKAGFLNYSDEIFSTPPERLISNLAAMRYSVLRLMPRISAAFFRLPPVASNTYSR
jgi:hypothetical protein